MQKAYDKKLLEESNSTEADLGLDYDLDLEPKKRVRSLRKRRTEKADRKARTLRIKKPWTDDETEKLIEALKEHGRNWQQVSTHVATRGKSSVRE